MERGKLVHANGTRRLETRKLLNCYGFDRQRRRKPVSCTFVIPTIMLMSQHYSQQKRERQPQCLAYPMKLRSSVIPCSMILCYFPSLCSLEVLHVTFKSRFILF